MTYKFKVGDKGRTRGTSTYEVIGTVSLNGVENLIVKIRQSNGSEILGRRDVFGRWSDDPCAVTVSDLMPPEVEKAIYVNVYADGVAASYDTADEARRVAGGCSPSPALVAHEIKYKVKVSAS